MTGKRVDDGKRVDAAFRRTAPEAWQQQGQLSRAARSAFGES